MKQSPLQVTSINPEYSKFVLLPPLLSNNNKINSDLPSIKVVGNKDDTSR